MRRLRRNRNEINSIIFALFIVSAIAARCETVQAATTCESLSELKLANTTITMAQTVAAGAFSTTGVAVPLYKELPVFCRVAGVIRPTADSEIKFEVWMPVSGWNRKFHGVGNGGFAGSINYRDMAAALARGFATASTDTGHSGGDASWALGHPEKLVDYGHRGIHEMTEKAKLVIGSFFGEGPKRSYFASCSNGGRQALMEAQRYPADYDGIIAGAPANAFTRALVGFAWNVQAILIDPASRIPASKLKAIEAAALAACDDRDGLKDGLIDDPTRCRFDASILLCKGAESDVCLTQKQVVALNNIYQGPRNARGQQITNGFVPGGESGTGGWGSWITGSDPNQVAQYFFSTQAFRNMLYDDAAWDHQTFDLEKSLALSEAKLAPIVSAVDPNLKAFAERGGKLMIWHGWSDAALPPQNTIDYFKSVQAKLGDRRSQSFLRLYMAPGMQHCGGGPGPNSFTSEMSVAIERWVEEGVAPEQIIATKRESADPKSTVIRTRPLCPYPRVARYKGSGSTDEAANFSCAMAEK